MTLLLADRYEGMRWEWSGKGERQGPREGGGPGDEQVNKEVLGYGC